ncbi:hypothetical protein V3C99_008338 [Haemonchus contortus]
MSGNNIDGVYTTLCKALESFGLLEDHPSYVVIYCYFLLTKIALVIMVICWKWHETSKTRSTLFMIYDEELPLISDLPMNTTPVLTKTDEKAK